MDNPGDAKYGMTKDQIIEAYKILKAKGVKRFGMHAFLASNTVTNEYYPTLAKILFETAVEIKEKTGVKLDFINLSGGVGIPYTLTKSQMTSWSSARVSERYMRKCLYRQAWVM